MAHGHSRVGPVGSGWVRQGIESSQGWAGVGQGQWPYPVGAVELGVGWVRSLG